MLEFSQVFSLGESLLPLLAHLIPETKEDGSFSSPDGRAQSALKLLHAKVIGREKDGTVLVSWRGVAGKANASGDTVTLIGLIDGRKPLSLLYSHDKIINVVSASIDQGRSLLSYTECIECAGQSPEDDDCTPHPGSSNEPIRTYRSFVVELQPAGRVLALNVERSLFQRTQFIYANSGRMSASKDVTMLYLLHRESVGIYHFKLQQLNDVLVIANQPVTCQLWSYPVWFQWSHTHQRLYFVYNEQQLSDDGDSDTDDNQDDALGSFGGGKSSTFHPVLRVAEFFDGGAHEVVLEVRLPFDMVINDAPMYDLQATWSDSVPDISCNMTVLQLGGENRMGALCVCYQHAIRKERIDSMSPTSLRYSVCILHHAYHMELSMPLMSALVDESSPYQLLFSVLGDYILTYIPGKLLHLLDCSTEHGAFHHMLLQDDVPLMPFNGSVALPWQFFGAQPSMGGLFDIKRQEAYMLSVHRHELAMLFSETQQESLRSAALHYALVHQRDTGLARKMIEHLCRDPAAPDCTTLLAEYLLAAAYIHMRRDSLDQTVMQLVPISLADAFRNHVEEGGDGCQHVRIAYNRMHSLKDQVVGCLPDASQATLAQVVVPSQNKLVLGLQRNLSLRDGPARFSLRAILHKLENAPAQSATPDGAASASHATAPEQLGFFRRLSTTLVGRKVPHMSRPSSAPASSPSSLPFLETQPEEEILAEHRRHLVVEHFRYHIKRHSHESTEKCQQIAQEYATTQMHHSKYLLNAIWTSLRHPSLSQPSQVLLSNRGGPRDKALFTMAEHFSAAVRMCGFPTPSGFNQFFAALGLRCLEPLVFLQYVQQNVFSLPLDFVRRAVHELNNNPENAELKFQILNRLKYNDVAKLLVEWGHPAALRYLTQQYVTAAMKMDAKESWELSSFNQKGQVGLPAGGSGGGGSDDVDGESLSIDEGIGINFPPVANLMQVLRAMELDMKREQLDPHLQQWSMNRVEDTCLQESQASTGKAGCVYPL